MPAVKKVCRVCGKEYEACKTPRPTDNTFRWQDVACSKECGAEYLRSVMIARGLSEEAAPEKADVSAEQNQIAEEVAATVKRTRKKNTKAASVTTESED